MKPPTKLMERGVSTCVLREYVDKLVLCPCALRLGKKLDYDPDFKGPIKGKARQEIDNSTL